MKPNPRSTTTFLMRPVAIRGMPFPSRTSDRDHARSVRESEGPRDAPPTSGSDLILSPLARTCEWREGGASGARPPLGRPVEVRSGPVAGVRGDGSQGPVVDVPRLQERDLVLEDMVHDPGLPLQPPVRAVERVLARHPVGLIDERPKPHDAVRLAIDARVLDPHAVLGVPLQRRFEDREPRVQPAGPDAVAAQLRDHAVTSFDWVAIV